MSGQTFNLSRDHDNFTEEGLTKLIGLSRDRWLAVVLKELVDNAVDALERSKTPRPRVVIRVEASEGVVRLEVVDNGPGIPPEVLCQVFDTRTRTSSNVGFIAPSRGKQGNALPSIMGMVAASWGPESLARPITVKTQDMLHIIKVQADAAGAAQVDHQQNVSSCEGTAVSVELPGNAQDVESLNRLLWAYPMLNPHVDFDVNDALSPSTCDAFRKWLPGAPSSPHWYAAEDLERLICYLRRDNPRVTIRDFIRRFKGLSSTKKAAAVSKVVPASNLGELTSKEAARLLDAMKDHSALVKPPALGELGSEHMEASLSRFGPVGRIRYKRVTGMTGGRPWVFELATARSEGHGLLAGVNHSPAIAWDPFGENLITARLPGSNSERLSGYGVDGLLREFHVRTDSAFAAVAHFCHPAPVFLDAGKTRLELEGEVKDAIGQAIVATCKGFRREGVARLKGKNLRQRTSVRGPSQKELVFGVLSEAIGNASGQGRFVFPLRNLYYSVRPLLQEFTGRRLDYGYFSQNLVTRYEEAVGEIPGLYRDPRGYLIEPHTGRKIALGTLEVESYELPPWQFSRVLYIEKKGLLPIVEAARLAERFDIAIIAAEGYASRAARRLLQRVERQALTILCLHDADPAGYEICRTLGEATASMPNHQVTVIDLGLHYEEAIELGLEPEEFLRRKELSSSLELTTAEWDAFTGRPEGKKQWRAHRVELNALAADPDKFIAFIEWKLEEHGCTQKLVPPPAVVLDNAQVCRQLEIEKMARSALEKALGLDRLVASIADDLVSTVGLEDIHAQLLVWGKENPPESWAAKTEKTVKERVGSVRQSVERIARGKIQEILSSD